MAWGGAWGLVGAGILMRHRLCLGEMERNQGQHVSVKSSLGEGSGLVKGGQA
jgi:hypothetical protein